MLVAVKTPRISVRVTGVGVQTVVKALRKLYDGVEVSRDMLHITSYPFLELFFDTYRCLQA